MIEEKGLNHLKRLMNQPIGNHQCYALSAEYAGVMIGPDMGAGTRYEVKVREGNIFSAAEIGRAYRWPMYLWTVINHPEYDQLEVGAIINWERNAQVSETFIAHDYFGHTGVIRGLESGRIQTYEQNAESGEIVAEYDRQFFGTGQIASICIPPDFEKGVVLDG
ncbi:CHAP domain-containing protein [Enterococcus malodoratus]|uniref:CHAP domain-containing protein n=1 Tax=Enterococcus malodoratus TaxID=71451 RepID=UPI0022E7AA29|nr:CHAP domain-containing protein [Enterococcus malodoratus]